MFGYIGGLARCATGRHERSLEHVRKRGEEYVSRCRFCRTPMRRLSKRDWIADPSAAE